MMNNLLFYVTYSAKIITVMNFYDLCEDVG